MEDSWLRDKKLPTALVSYYPISLSIGFDLFGLLLTSSTHGTSRGMPLTLKTPLSERVCFSWDMFLANWTGPLGVKGFFCCLFFLIPIYTRIGYPLGMGHSGDGECKGCCLGSLYYINNTLNMCTILQQQYSVSLLHEQGHTAEALDKI